MVAGPVVSRLMERFQDKEQLDRPEYMWHHDQQASADFLHEIFAIHGQGH